MDRSPNALRLRDPDPRGHVESHFLKLTSPDCRRALWLKHTVLRPHRRPQDTVSEVWAVAFDPAAGPPVGAKVSHPLSELRQPELQQASGPFTLRTPAAELRVDEHTGHAEGAITSSDHALSWVVTFDHEGEAYWPFPFEWMYRGRVPRSKTVTPVPCGTTDGHVVVDGNRWELSGWHVAQGHNWGREHTAPYAWTHCNRWDDGADGAWFEAVTARVRLGPVLTPWLTTGAIHVDGRTYRFDTAGALFSRSVRADTTSLAFSLESRGWRLVAEVWADPTQMAGLRYQNPDGSSIHCLNSKLAQATVTLEGKDVPARTLQSRCAALEIGTRDTSHGIPILL